jgi:hypothetical protein
MLVATINRLRWPQDDLGDHHPLKAETQTSERKLQHIPRRFHCVNSNFILRLWKMTPVSCSSTAGCKRILESVYTFLLHQNHFVTFISLHFFAQSRLLAPRPDAWFFTETHVPLQNAGCAPLLDHLLIDGLSLLHRQRLASQFGLAIVNVVIVEDFRVHHDLPCVDR